MPRRKKTDQSPARVPDGPPPEWGSLGHNAGYPAQAPGQQASTASYFVPSSTSISSAEKEKVVTSMQEMFSHLDPEVIYIVLSECDFKVENAMDSLLELSVAAEVAAPVPSPVSGFERTAAALLNPGHFPEARPQPEVSDDSGRPYSPSSGLLTEEFDLLVDQELQTLTAQRDATEKQQSGSSSDADASLSSFPPPPLLQQDLPELLQSSLKSGSRGPPVERPGSAGRLVERLSAASSPLNQHSSREEETTGSQQSVLDFTHLMPDASQDNAKLPFDLAASGRPSAFQVYKKQEPPPPPPQVTSDAPGLLYSDAIGGARSKIRTLNQEPLGYVSSAWNLEAPVFTPQFGVNQCPAANNSGAQTVPNWFGQPRHASPWFSMNPVSQAPLKPCAAIPKSWALPAAPQAAPRNSRLHLEGRVLVLLRGAPGSGKSTLARALLDCNPGGVVLGTDDYFNHNGHYQFDPTLLGEAHEWNHKRAKEAFEMGKYPIIIDNTNMQGWEMRPYVAQALRHGYKVLFKEPDTVWKNKPRELERRSTHSVPVETIRRMLNGYERFVTVQSIMGSRMPEWKQRLLLEDKSTQPVSSGSLCPDLVDQPSLTEQLKESRSQLFSSLPDVSSIGHSAEAETLEKGVHKSSESLNFQLTGTSTDNRNLSDGEDVDLGNLDSELDARLERDVNNAAGEQRMPDCIVESVMNEDHCVDDLPLPFPGSIQQRVKRERPSRRSEFYKMEPVDLVKDTNESDRKENGKEEQADGTEMAKNEEEGAASKSLDFVGDWPSECPLNQRQVRERAAPARFNGCSPEEDKESESASGHPGPNVMEFQKLLDLIQTGVVPDRAGSSRSHSPSPNPGERLQRGDKTGEKPHGSRSNSEERKQGRGELPDCVLDYKAAESCVARELKNNNSEGLGKETRAISEGSDNFLEFVKEAFTKSHSIISEAEADAEFHGRTDIGGEFKTEAPISWLDEACQSPVCDSECSPLTGGSQDKKQRQGRRSGKQCKLALTFTQNYSESSLNPAECPSNSSQNSENNCNSDVTPSTDPGLDLKPNPEPPSEPEADLQLQTTPPLPEETGRFTQTEPQDFAVLWRLNRQDAPEDWAVAAGSRRCGVTVLSGDASRFVPELSSAASAADAVHPSGHKEVPYRVVHEKGTEVEEKEFGVTQDHLESLRILSRHFKLVSFDTLEDLYEKCQQDLQWTTNLLLDSGERFFRDEDRLEEEEEAKVAEGENEDHNSRSRLCGALQQTASLANVLEETANENKLNGELPVVKERTLLSTCQGDEGSGASHPEAASFKGGTDTEPEKDPTNSTRNLEKSLQAEPSEPPAVKEEERLDNTMVRVLPEGDLAGGALGASSDSGVVMEELRDHMEDELASMDEVNRLLQAELDEIEREENQRREWRPPRGQHLDIQSVELKLPTELALQLTELFGPVGVDPGACSAEDCSVQMDLSLAKLLHQQWKETIQERQKQATLSFHLLQEGTDRLASQDGRRGPMPFMDHWNASRPQVSLRDIIKEEQALQKNVEKTRENRAELDRRDGATLLKENQLYALFPNIDKHFIQDIFRDHNYSLAQTELFLRSLLFEEPVKTVVAPEVPRSGQNRGTSKEREKVRQKPSEVAEADYQDTEDPEYEDFRAEASLQRQRQLESFTKAAEAHKQGRKEVASFYAQQGRLHGHRMREANHRAAAQIFERVNSSLLPNNILDLHGLHVDEALQHLAQVLQDKIADYEQGLCRPQLSVITGRGNHSQGGVARIRPAVVDYLTHRHYRFTEPKPGLVLVSLK